MLVKECLPCSSSPPLDLSSLMHLYLPPLPPPSTLFTAVGKRRGSKHHIRSAGVCIVVSTFSFNPFPTLTNCSPSTNTFDIFSACGIATQMQGRSVLERGSHGSKHCGQNVEVSAHVLYFCCQLNYITIRPTLAPSSLSQHLLTAFQAAAKCFSLPLQP